MQFLEDLETGAFNVGGKERHRAALNMIHIARDSNPPFKSVWKDYDG